MHGSGHWWPSTTLTICMRFQSESALPPYSNLPNASDRPAPNRSNAMEVSASTPSPARPMTEHVYGGISRLEAHRAEIARARRLSWPYHRIIQHLAHTHGVPISYNALKSFCLRRGIEKGKGETGDVSPLLPPPASTARPEVETEPTAIHSPCAPKGELPPKIPRKKKREKKFRLGDSNRPFRTRINPGPTEG